MSELKRKYLLENPLTDAIVSKEKGSLIFPADLLPLAGYDAVRQALARLAKEGILKRLGKGIYLYPKYDKELGMLYPSSEEIVSAIATREKARVIPTGSHAMNKLGISTQVPMKEVYLTDGMRRTIRLGKRTITFKITTPRKLATKGKYSTLVILALEEMGKNSVDAFVIRTIKKYIAIEDPELLRHDARLAPVWVNNLLNSLIKEMEHENMAAAAG